MDQESNVSEINIDQEIRNLDMLMAELNGQKTLLLRIRDGGFEIRKKVEVKAGEATVAPEGQME